jgi:hypothetical protein
MLLVIIMAAERDENGDSEFSEFEVAEERG